MDVRKPPLRHQGHVAERVACVVEGGGAVSATERYERRTAARVPVQVAGDFQRVAMHQDPAVARVIVLCDGSRVDLLHAHRCPLGRLRLLAVLAETPHRHSAALRHCGQVTRPVLTREGRGRVAAAVDSDAAAAAAVFRQIAGHIPHDIVGERQPAVLRGAVCLQLGPCNLCRGRSARVKRAARAAHRDCGRHRAHSAHPILFLSLLDLRACVHAVKAGRCVQATETGNDTEAALVLAQHGGGIIDDTVQRHPTVRYHVVLLQEVLTATMQQHGNAGQNVG
mmetsp:Transcript_84067/g.216424  ORF Transcript_84067/g.216424 Transcript_84067/m.216424 type:complete len:281 (-) Transcript_84067:1127-1969(-)